MSLPFRFVTPLYECSSCSMPKKKRRRIIPTTQYKKSSPQRFRRSEDIVTYQYTKFNSNAVDNDFDSPIVYAMHKVSDAVHAYGKEMLWIPYYHPNNSYIAPQAGYVINKTNIFDTVILQPSYYFNSEHSNGVNVISKCVEKQAIVNSSGSIIGGTKTSNTVIGFEMEINEKYYTDSAYKTRYNTYVSAFSKFVGKYPTAFYASNPDVMIGLTPVIGDFFDSSHVIRFCDVNAFAVFVNVSV